MWRAVVLTLALGGGAGAALANPAGQYSASAAAERAFTRASPRPAWADVLPVSRAAKAQGPYSIALHDVQIHLDAGRAVYLRRAIEVHDATALQTVGRIDIDFLPDFQTLELHAVSVIRDGKRFDRLQQAQVRFLQRETGLEQGVYTGAVTANIVVADLRVGDVLDVEYTVRGSNPVMGGKFFYSIGWDSGVYVGRRRVLLDTPEARRVQSRLVGQDGRPGLALPGQRSEHRNGRTRLSFDSSAQAAYLGENHLPPEAHAYRWLQFSEMASWDEVSRWAVELFPYDGGGTAFEALLRQLRAAGTPEQQAVKALEFVQSEVRYLSVSIGQNSHRPVAPETVLQRRYGDCKDKSLLLATLLRRLGLEAHVALLWTDLPTGVERLLPSPQVFDHAIVHLRIQGKQYLLDPTSQGQHGSLAQMGQPYRAHQFLLVRGGTGALAMIDAGQGARPLSRRIERFDLERPGSPAQLTVTREFTGNAAEAMRVQLASASRDEHVKGFASAMVERYADAVPDTRVDGGMTVQDDRGANLLRLVHRFRIATLFTRAGQRWRVPFSASNLRELFHKSDSPERQYPLLATSLQPGDAVEYEFDLRMREASGLSPDRSSVTVSDPAFEFQGDDELDPKRIHMRMKLRAGTSRVAPSALAAYAQKLTLLEQQLGGSFTFADAAPQDEPAPPASLEQARPATPPVQTAQQQLEARLAQLDKTIANAAFRATDPAPALCERARTHQALNQPEAALKDVQQAVRLHPKDGALLQCRADIGAAQRRFKEAEADYARAAALGADGAALFQARALNALYLGQPDKAAAQFRVALGAADDELDRLRARIWLALLKSEPAGAAAAPGGDAAWLAVVLDAVQGKVRPDQAVAAATGDAGAGADAQLGETYFYLGKAMITKGERWKALAYFKQALTKLALDHPYTYAARFELAPEEKKP